MTEIEVKCEHCETMQHVEIMDSEFYPWVLNCFYCHEKSYIFNYKIIEYYEESGTAS